MKGRIVPRRLQSCGRLGYGLRERKVGHVTWRRGRLRGLAPARNHAAAGTRLGKHFEELELSLLVKNLLGYRGGEER